MRKIVFILTVLTIFNHGLTEASNSNSNVIIKNDVKTSLSAFNSQSDSFVTNDFMADTCTITIKGYDEWGCYFKYEWNFTSPDMTPEICDALGATMWAFFTISTLM